MVSPLDDLIWSATNAIRATRFSRVLRNARVIGGDRSLPAPSDELRGWETSFDPAIQRTLAATMAWAAHTHSSPNLQGPWYEWNTAALGAIRRVASKFWAGIDPQRRLLLVDRDNIQPLLNEYHLFQLRDVGAGQSMDFEGLGDEGTRTALREIYRHVRDRPEYKQALRADRELAASDAKVFEWALRAQRGHAELDRIRQTMTIGESIPASRDAIAVLYRGSPVEEIAEAFRDYNRLVHRVCWAILGLADAIPEPFTITNPVGSVRQDRGPEGQAEIHVSTVDDGAGALRLCSPVRLDAGLPVDGVYLVVGHTFRFRGSTADDLRLVPLARTHAR